jgi:hypothetical protein
MNDESAGKTALVTGAAGPRPRWRTWIACSGPSRRSATEPCACRAAAWDRQRSRPCFPIRHVRRFLPAQPHESLRGPRSQAPTQGRQRQSFSAQTVPSGAQGAPKPDSRPLSASLRGTPRPTDPACTLFSQQHHPSIHSKSASAASRVPPHALTGCSSSAARSWWIRGVRCAHRQAAPLVPRADRGIQLDS